MVTVDSFFGESIQQALLNEIAMAKKTIHIAVAWFTDHVLFESLLKRQRDGISIHLCIVNDQINFKDGGIRFADLNSAKCEFIAVESSKMHHKFCVVDDSIVITGSYNWTLAAAHSGKDENVIVTTGDYELASKFLDEFYKVIGKPRVGYEEVDLARCMRRMTAIQNLIQLEETEDVQKQAARLQIEGRNNRVIRNITEKLFANQFADALKEIKDFISQHTTLQTYVEPEIDALRLEIKMLEYQILAFENEKAEAENIVFEYDLLFNLHVGKVLMEILRLKEEIKKQLHAEGKVSEQEYMDVQQAHEAYEKAYEETETRNKEFQTLSEGEKSELKSLYKSATLLCHPDKFVNEPEKQKQAEEIFKQLNNAYRNQDIETVRYIYVNLKSGKLNLKEELRNTTDIDLLRYKKDYLQRHCTRLFDECNQIKTSPAFMTMKIETNHEEYFAKIKMRLEKEL